MTMSNSITLAAVVAAFIGSVFEQRPAWSEPGELRKLVHHGGAASGPILADPVTHIVKVAEEACYRRGADEAGLRVWADTQHWTPVGAQELSRQQNEFSTLTGGWTVKNAIGAFALIQSRIKSPNIGSVCSITVQPVSADQHLQLKQAFAKRFGADIAEEVDRPDQHTDRYWLENANKPPVKASMTHTRSSSTMTIRMIHGGARPLGS
jgi:hypothetical protein